MQEIRSRVLDKVKSLLDNSDCSIDYDTQLLGMGAILDSMKLVELSFLLEEMASDLDFEFIWTSDSVFSVTHSIFRTVGTLADEFVRQMDNKK